MSATAVITSLDAADHIFSIEQAWLMMHTLQH